MISSNRNQKEQNSEELNKIMGTINKIMGTIVYKQEVLSNDNEETSIVQLKEEIYQHMNLLKLEDLSIVPLEEIKRKLDKKIW